MITGGWLDGTTGSVVGAGDDVGGMVVEAAVSGGAGGVATVDEVDGAGDVTVAVVVDVAGTAELAALLQAAMPTRLTGRSAQSTSRWFMPFQRAV